MAKKQPEVARDPLLCTWTGCTRTWTENMGRPLCAEHARVSARRHLESRLRLVAPSTPPEQPWCEPRQKDDEA